MADQRQIFPSGITGQLQQSLDKRIALRRINLVIIQRFEDIFPGRSPSLFVLNTDQLQQRINILRQQFLRRCAFPAAMIGQRQGKFQQYFSIRLVGVGQGFFQQRDQCFALLSHHQP